MEITNLAQTRKRAKQFKELRAGVLRQLYPTVSTQTDDPQTQIMGDFLGSFKRYFGNQETVFDREGPQSGGSSQGTNLMERQVRRALTSVLGRAPGKGSSSFISALNDAFPLTTQGVNSTQTRSIVSMYNQSGSPQAIAPGVVGQLSNKQAALYRQTSVVASDGLMVLEGLHSFVPEADQERVEALRALVRSEINTLVEEFGRVDEPRVTRVQAYLNSLEVHIAEFGARAFLNNPALVATVDDESQVTGFSVLKNYARILQTIWRDFNKSERRNEPSLSERLERANVLLPIIAQGNNEFQQSLDSVGFSESERHSQASKFSGLATRPIFDLTNGDSRNSNLIVDVFAGAPPASSLPSATNTLDTWLPAITVYDLTDWLDQLFNTEAPTLLTDSGQYGLEFVTYQADRLFWTIVPVVAHLKTIAPINLSSRSTLEQILSNERVSWSLDNLLTQINALADLAV